MKHAGEIIIREATPADSPVLANIFLVARQSTFDWMDPGSFSLLDFSAQTEGERVFLAESPTGEVVGFIAVWVNACFIHHLFILPAYQRQGIGQRLINSLLAWLPLPYRLKCLVRNEAALAFYRQNGWQQLETGNTDGEEFILLELKDIPAVISPARFHE